jgi:uncharacterized protein (DUF952 family)
MAKLAHVNAPELGRSADRRLPPRPDLAYRTAMSDLIYKICTAAQWRYAEDRGVFEGAPIDIADGYIHFSTAAQVAETAAKHFAGQGDLLLVAVDAGTLGDGLKWEVSRGGALFPHLYAPFDPRGALWARPLPLGADGRHVFPDLGA